MKITLHLKDGRELNFYKNVSKSWIEAHADIDAFVKQFAAEAQREPLADFQLYWIDAEGDEILILNGLDYEIFLNENEPKPRLHINLVGVNTKPQRKQQLDEQVAAETFKNETAQAVPPSASSKQPKEQQQERAAIIHPLVECDGCNMAPIVGFRYKCIQCSNFDLCERCEAAHKHSHHMMVRMPHNKCPNVVQTWIEAGRHHGVRRSARKHCPFMDFEVGDENTAAAGCDAANETNAAADGDGNGKERRRHHGRKHHKREMRSNFFSNLYCMMHDLAEGGGAVNENLNASSAAAAEQAKAAATAAQQDACIAAQQAAAAAAEVAAKVLGTTMEQIIEPAAAAAATAVAAQQSEASASTTSTAVPDSASDEQGASAQSEPQAEAKQSSNNTSTPILSPTLENLAQFLDPKYMKTGLQILNNFNEMFAKMLDPTVAGSEAASSAGCPFMSKNDVDKRKNSNASNTSNVTNSTASTSTNTVEQQTSPVEKPQEQSNEKQVAEPLIAIESPVIDAVSVAVSSTPPREPAEFVVNSPESRVHSRSQSDDNEWQLVDDHSDDGSSSNNTSINETRNASIGNNTTAIDIDFNQLSQDLRAHIEEEQQRASATATLPTAPIATPRVAASTPPAAAAPVKTEETRAVPVFHADQRINNAVLAMMAMGFSNEGACLTQLLESVNGNIPEALDLMSAAQLPNGRR